MAAGRCARCRSRRNWVSTRQALAALNPAFIRFSSGTTGTSKGIVLSHESLLARVTAANRGLGIGPADRVVWILPMAHHFAVSIMLYLLHGATTIIENSHLAEDVLCARRRSTAARCFTARRFIMRCSPRKARAAPWPTLRLAVSTAATLPLATAQAFDQRYGLPLTQGLGIIEVGLPLLNLQRAREKPTSRGPAACPITPAEVRGARGRAVSPRAGHVRRLSPSVAHARGGLEDGWFRTGDLARVDEDGDIHLLGRSHSVINVAGLKCFPEEIEAVLCEVPEVRRARVLGKPNAAFRRRARGGDRAARPGESAEDFRAGGVLPWSARPV